jgi:EAL domain-containing protein (putative c-di-GMP-specific phosphodiesterase class I)
MKSTLKTTAIFTLLFMTIIGFYYNFKLLFLFSILGICVWLYQLYWNHDNVVVAHQKEINKTFRNKKIDCYFVTIIEITNLANLSQFYDVNLKNKIIEQLYKLLKKQLPHVYYYSSNQLIIINQFVNKVVSTEQLRTEEQDYFIQSLLTHIKQQQIKMNEGRHYYKVEAKAGLGCSGKRKEYQTIDDLIRLAHFSLITAKNQNIDYKIATEETRIIKSDIEDFNKEIEQGIIGSEFKPYYLPIIDLTTMKITGIESLLRWEKEQYRIIEASKFKDIAIEKHIFDQLDMLIIEQTLKDYKSWIDKKLIQRNITITLNVSKQTLLQLSLSKLLVLLQEYHLSPEQIEFDVSEHDLQDDMVLRTIKRIKDKKFKVSVDAFYSSINSFHTLLNVEVNTIKIDKNNLPLSLEDSYNKRFLETFKLLSDTLQYSVVAKGIENKSQLALAKELHINYGQGFYFTKPLDSIHIKEYLNKYKSGYNI